MDDDGGDADGLMVLRLMVVVVMVGGWGEGV